MMIRRYSELILLPTFEERFEYLKLSGEVCKETFGFDRYLNQMFYHSPEWKATRDKVIVRDNGCDLGVEGYEILGFYDKEVYDYVTRETIILTIIGITLGLIGGYFLNYYFLRLLHICL